MILTCMIITQLLKLEKQNKIVTKKQLKFCNFNNFTKHICTPCKKALCKSHRLLSSNLVFNQIWHKLSHCSWWEQHFLVTKKPFHPRR